MYEYKNTFIGLLQVPGYKITSPRHFFVILENIEGDAALQDLVLISLITMVY